MTKNIQRSSRVLLAAVCFACASLLFAASASAQAKKPITKQGLINAVKISGLTTPELVQQIQLRGVDFEMTADDEADLQSVGVRPEVIKAARNNYHGAVTAPRTPTPTPPPRSNTTGPESKGPDGPPLSKREIVTMLLRGVDPARVEQLVEKRGVSFQLTSGIAREITAAGGNRSLVGAIAEKSAPDSTTVPARTRRPSQRPQPKREEKERDEEVNR